MDRGPMMFTSDVSLPKDDKIAMRGKQIISGQFTGLYAQTNANYATKKGRGLKAWAVSKTSRPKSICIYLLIIHLEISIQNILLVLSCESHPKCKHKEIDNCIKELCVK